MHDPRNNVGINSGAHFDGCFVWRGSRTAGGYGVKGKKKTKEYTHRLAYAWVNGPIPPGMCVLHHCDNPPCCNPDHLFLGTHADNVADMVAKGRQQRGEASGHAKLTVGDVVVFRELLEAGLDKKYLCEFFDVRRQTLNDIIFGRTWTHVGLEIEPQVEMF